ncbi:MAG TPA: TonB-dependent receptor, partial [Casimicrobiaceae bacterium]|nr:TonB-dependent receptor [Casimicrobiaceae bacterium]
RVSTSGFRTHLDVADGAVSQRSEVRDLRAAGSATSHYVSHDLSLGYDATWSRLRYESSSAQTGTTDFDILQRPVSVSGWLDDLWRLSPRWLVESGLRAERLTGGRDWSALSPRLAVKYFLTPAVALTAAAGRVSQTMHSLAGDGPLRFFDVWLASDEYIPVETAWHYVLGAERRVERSSVRVEGYVKKYDRVFDANVSDDPSRRGDEFLSATGLTYGVDLLARWQSLHGPSGWVAYSYGVASHERDGMRWAPGNDRRHDLNVVATWQLARYRLGARFGYATGTPYTPIVGEIVRRAYDPANDTWGTGNPPLYLEPLGGIKNSARFPATQRLDLDVSREMSYHGATIAPYVSVVNAYNARNVFVYLYDYSTDHPTRRGYTQFPILPSAGVRIAF